MDKWYYSWNGEKLGPVSLRELQKLAEEGTLEVGDLVWTKGMANWQPAGTVADLPFSDEPPPLPNAAVIRPAMQGRWDEAVPAGAHWMWSHKAVSLFVASVLCFLLAAAFESLRMPSHYSKLAVISGLVFLGGLSILGIVSFIKFAAKSYRIGLLMQKWESSTGDGSWMQFSQDGGFIRHDGLGAKYSFDVPNDKIELRPVDDSAPIILKVVLLTDKELAVNWDGKTLHFRKPSWWKKLLA